MEYLIGAGLALVVGISTSLIGMDRDRALYPTVLIVIALLYDLYAVMGGSNEALVAESAFGAIFIALAVVGFRTTLWFTVAGLALHGLFDFVHGQFVTNPGVPVFWPAFCSAYDVVAAIYLGWLIASGRVGGSVSRSL